MAGSDAEDRLAKQDKKKLPNPTGKGGFGDNPENINRKGRPPRGWSWAELLEDVGEEIEEKTGKKFKHLVSKRLWIECVNGNVGAIKELMNRMEGLPKQSLEHTGKDGKDLMPTYIDFSSSNES